MLDALNKELLFIAIVLKGGLENFVMFSKYRVRLPHRTEVCLAPNCVKMEGIVETQMTVQTVTSVSAPLGFKAVIVRKR